MKSKRFLVVLLSMLVCSLIGGLPVGAPDVKAQETEGLTVIIDEIKVDEYDTDKTIEVYVTVRHLKGRPAEGLIPDDFTLSVSGTQPFIPDTVEMTEDAPVSIAIVLELYQSMRGQPLEDAKEAIRHLCVDDKSIYDKCALFGVRPGVVPDSLIIDEQFERTFTNDGGEIANFVQGLQVVAGQGGGTPLYDTIAKALHITAQTEPPGRRAVLVITDGGDRGSFYTDADVIGASRSLQVPIFAIGYTGGNRQNQESLKEIAINTKGDYREAPETTDFKDFLSDTRYELSRHYRLTYTSKELGGGRQVMEVRVDASGLYGTDSQAFDIQTGSIPPTPLPTTESGEAPTPETTDESPDEDEGEGEGEEENGLFENPLILGGVIGGLLIISIVAALLVRSRQKQRDTEPSWPVDDDSSDYTPPTTEEFNGGFSPTPIIDNVPPAGSTQVGTYGNAPPLQTGQPIPPTAVDYGPPPPISGSGSVFGAEQGSTGPQQPPRQAKTLILGPQMDHYAMLISQRTNAKYDINEPTVNIGRASDNQLKLEGEKLSRHHATVRLENDTFQIQDLGSSNGTFVNGTRIYAPVALQDGDIVRLGDQDYVFKVIH
ncbi:MAG: FHA domain-containing protein [Anaerolineae bacterium]|nr:FHA domain-containing protein [Anaerolineae bacterium]